MAEQSKQAGRGTPHPPAANRPELDIFASPLNIGPHPKDVVEPYNVPPGMPKKDPLGYLPAEQKGGRKR
jgi:hypothetical protein